MKEVALFISNSIYFDSSKQEGGVKICTEDYLSLIKCLFEVQVFEVQYQFSLTYRLRVKFGMNVYNDYKPELYLDNLIKLIRLRKVSYVFLNLSNTVPFAKVIKKVFGSQVKVILCSHGNESGDFLHSVTRFKHSLPIYRSFFSSISLGDLLKKESRFRHELLDGVLTVSPVEEALEHWLGAKHVLMVPRTIKKQLLNRNIVKGRFGFIGDLSHTPNLFGLEQVCNAIQSLSFHEGIDIRIAGSPLVIGEKLSQKYSFVTFLGYLDNDALAKEASTWTFFINPVFYYSRGVSTKLAKALGWGLPVITTTIGHRGYLWSKGSFVVAETATEMAEKIKQYYSDENGVQKANEEILKLISSIPNHSDNARQLDSFLHRL